MYLNQWQDPSNSEHTRNAGNTPVDDYNCGGFALGTFSWFMPYYSSEERENSVDEMIEDGVSRRDIMDTLTEEDIDYILDNVDDIYRIRRPSDAPKDTRVIAYRVTLSPCGTNNDERDAEDMNLGSYFLDFHFRVRINGYWFEKNGFEDIKPCKFEEGDWDCGDNLLYYDGQIIYFAMPEPQKADIYD